MAGIVPVIKIQIAFYESLGIRAARTYGRAIRIAKQHGLLVIGDIKRGDVGSTAEAYADAHFGSIAASNSMDADAVTLSPYLGFDAIAPFMPFVKDAGKGLYLLVRTSNPSAPDLQDEILRDGRRLFEHVSDTVAKWGSSAIGERGYSSLGMVVGATYPHELEMLKQRHPHSLFLVPGYGAQGGTAESIAAAFRSDSFDFLVASSREILKVASTRDFSHRECVAALALAATSMRDNILAAFARLHGRTAP